MQKKKYWIWLSLIDGLGSIRKRKLLEQFKEPEIIYNLKKEQLLKVDGIGENLANKIINIEKRKCVDKHVEYMLKNNIDIININDKEYPQILKQIYDYPISIYIKGNKEILNNEGLAIIGCRDASEYGKKAAKYFSYNLAKEGINIISGLAKGIDSFAHIGAIAKEFEETNKINKKYNNKGKTIAVIGNGLDTIYPKENNELADKIIETGGAIITEYPLGTKPEKNNFPARNRIVSGISKGVLVIEAKEKSGTLITVDFALEQGKDVYVIPGNINSINSVGTNRLIKQGANLITNYKEILLDKK